ncbi:MAG: hypothetical protein Q8M88_08760 [Phenylobacterium sp.]|uniref:hypothetical protein n=1 Tax=Phenylobacterium sp. TaxID=1871053 RepID=UPI002733015A|nr:hypothetical protein [Phenylobacterium sp.]MDP3174508.1 hypothetical protein [Phenylobacterium sp.]
MRFVTLTLLPALLPILLLGACTTTRADGSAKIQTTSEANRENLQGALAAPLRDVNVLRTKIPDVLLQAEADPYQRPASGECEELRALVAPLNDALGEDLDLLAIENASMMVKGRETALGAIAGLTTDVIPFRGWVRKLTGAEQHDKLVAQAIMAGAVRRAYLKGLGESKGCEPPATPSHLLSGTPPVEQEPKPRYPVR